MPAGKANGTRPSSPFPGMLEDQALPRHLENTGFRCILCGASVAPVTNGSYRNHCPECLHSRHVDIRRGDRANPCRSLMVPVGVDHSGKKGHLIVHRCLGCGAMARNRAAADTVQPDRLTRFMEGLAKGTVLRQA